MIKTAIAFALGCALIFQITELPPVTWLWLTAPLLLLLRVKALRLVSIVVLGFLYSLFHAHITLNDRLHNSVQGQEVTITGQIASVPVKTNNTLRFEFSPEKSNLTALPSRIRLSWYAPYPEQLWAGETWQLTVKLKPPHGNMNPGGFDYEAWLFQQGIGATGYVRQASTNQKQVSAAYFDQNRIRQALANNIANSINNTANTGLLQGLTTGIKHQITPHQWQVLRNTGTSHLLAISGLHIGLAALLGFFIGKSVWRLRSRNLLYMTAIEAGAIGGVLFALLYAALAGFSIPTQRALIMVSTVLLGLLIRRSISIGQTLAISMLLVLLWDPFAVLSAGFLLSFSAVTIILIVSLHRFPKPTYQWLKIHLFIAFGLSPLLLILFHQTSMVAPLANILAVPFVSFILVPIVLLASILSIVSEQLASLLFQFADQLINLSWPYLDWLAKPNGATWHSPTIAITYLIVMVGAGLILLLPKGFPAKWLALLAFVPLFLYRTEHIEATSFQLTVLDVGQGLSAVIETCNHTLIFDTGPRYSRQSDSGKTVLLPFFQHRNINHIDTLIVSHSDNDHIGGAQSVMNTVSINTVLTSDTKTLAGSQPCLAGDSWTWDGVDFMILNPSANDVGSENNLSCVLKVSSPAASVLLSADIEYDSEQKLIARYPNQLKSDVLIAPHHGSNTSSSTAFIKYVNPEYVIFPVAYANRWDFPKPQVLNRYQPFDPVIFTNAKHGAVIITATQGQAMQIKTWRQHAARIWTHQLSTTD